MAAAEPGIAYGSNHTREHLDDFLGDYNKQFSTSFSTKDSKSFENYFKNLSQRLKEREKKSFNDEKDRLDIVLVVNMLLTGFDAKKVNTMYVDKNLKHHGLIQAFSRTNRILGGGRSRKETYFAPQPQKSHRQCDHVVQQQKCQRRNFLATL